MLRILILMVASALLLLADAPVLQTGQIKSYGSNGIVVTDGSVKDDGYYKVGAAISYSRSGNVVTDNTTGLEWQDNEVVTRPWTTQANYTAGDYNNTSGATAMTYCSNLPLDGEGWRLPTIRELQTLVKYSKVNPSATEGIFNSIVPSSYWSSSTSVRLDSQAWVEVFYQGLTTINEKNLDAYVRCVRGEPLSPSTLSRNGNIIIDSSTGLEWQDDEVVETETRTWLEAINYCENILILGGYDDWRLPNINELLSIVDYTTYNPALDTWWFQNYSMFNYWSSTSFVLWPTYAWNMYSFNGNSAYFDKLDDEHNYVRCVRGGQINKTVNPSIIMYLLN